VALQTTELKDWICVSAPGRWDAFNFVDSKTSIDSIVASTNKLAINMSGIQFVNLPMIQYLYKVAVTLRNKGGAMVIIGASEKLKKQIRIFASWDHLQFYSADGWEKFVNTNQEGHA